MKIKLFLLTLLAVILSNCEISPQNVKASDYENTHIYKHIWNYSYKKYGITYDIYNLNDNSVFVINHTKELLETELVQLQIEKLKSTNNSLIDKDYTEEIPKHHKNRY